MTHTITGDVEIEQMRARRIPLGTANPRLLVSNVDEAIKHYRDVLGFYVEFALNDESGSAYLANMCRGGLAVFLVKYGEHGPSSTFSWLRDAKLLDALHEDLLQCGANIKDGPEHKPWGIYEMTVVDPYKNEFKFATNSPKVTGDFDDLRGKSANKE